MNKEPIEAVADAPKFIYLQLSDEPCSYTEAMKGDVSWCADKIFEYDIKYQLVAPNTVTISSEEYGQLKADAERLHQFEKWSNEGLRPALVFNDNGYWAISFEGFGACDFNEPPISDTTMAVDVKSTDWETSVRASIDKAMAMQSQGKG